MRSHTFTRVKHKYHNQPVKINGSYYSSKLEANYKSHLDLLSSSGEVLFYLRQVPFHLPGGIKYVVDFQIFWKSGEVSFSDCKGVMTDLCRTKISIVEALYPIKIEIIKKGDF
jgi:hypothetical protein